MAHPSEIPSIKTLSRVNLFRLSILFMVLAFAASFIFATAASAQSSQRDCDANAVLRCGALTTGEVNRKYSSTSDAKTIFLHHGISSADVENMPSTAKRGHVTKDGKVLVNGETVATNAKTSGRQNMPGSTKVSKNGATFYSRPPSASFQQDKLDALVVMKNGQFDFAVITSCGNPVNAKPVKKRQPAAAPVTEQQPTPPQQQQQQQQQSQSVIVEQPVQKVETPAPAVKKQDENPPPPAPVQETPAPSPVVKGDLPETGLSGSAIAGFTTFVTTVSSLGYLVFSRFRAYLMS